MVIRRRKSSRRFVARQRDQTEFQDRQAKSVRSRRARARAFERAWNRVAVAVNDAHEAARRAGEAYLTAPTVANFEAYFRAQGQVVALLKPLPSRLKDTIYVCQEPSCYRAYFLAKRRGARFCSVACRVAAHRQRVTQ
jgi:hypothetical protein